MKRSKAWQRVRCFAHESQADAVASPSDLYRYVHFALTIISVIITKAYKISRAVEKVRIWVSENCQEGMGPAGANEQKLSDEEKGDGDPILIATKDDPAPAPAPAGEIRGFCPGCGKGVYSSQDRSKDKHGDYWHSWCCNGTPGDLSDPLVGSTPAV